MLYHGIPPTNMGGGGGVTTIEIPPRFYRQGIYIENMKIFIENPLWDDVSLTEKWKLLLGSKYPKELNIDDLEGIVYMFINHPSKDGFIKGTFYRQI